MDEYTADAFANRNDPIPLLTVTSSDVDASSSGGEREKEGRRQRLKRQLSVSISPSRIKEKVHELGSSHAEKMESSPGSASLQDRLFAKLLQQVIPDLDNGEDVPIDMRSSKYIRRPAFSLPVMTNNFRRFNARIGIVFVFQNRLIRLFTWKTTTHTLSFLAVYTFVCLDPSLLVVLPLATALLFIMVPAFITRHPPPPSTSTSSTTPYSQYTTYSGPALAPPRTIRPAAETSKDFFRNMRDLQNSMADFANVHDTLVSLVAPATNFSNEIRSSTLFLYLTIVTTLAFISAHLLPWRLIFLIAGNAITISTHPTAQVWLLKMHKKAEQKARDTFSPTTATPTLNPPFTTSTLVTKPSPSSSLQPPPPKSHALTQTLTSTFHSLSAITLDSSPETREVEIFELQHRPLLPAIPSAISTEPAPEWSPHLFTPLPYDPLSPSRIAGDRPRGTRFFADVAPPRGWAWEGKKWALDLDASEWVAERLIVGVEYDAALDPSQLDTTTKTAEAAEGNFGGWVWDLPPAAGGTRDEEVWLAYGDYEIPKPEDKEKGKGKSKGHKKGAMSRDWEEGIGRGRTGEWRRRRWVRVVKRVGVVEEDDLAAV